MKPSRYSPKEYRVSLLFLTVGLATLLLILFFKSFDPSYVVFSNDGPLGGMVAEQNQLPAILTGLWQDLNWLGTAVPAPSPTISTGFRLLLGPVEYSKFFCPIAILFCGTCAWFLFWRLRLAPVACALSGFAAALNSGFLSGACWGVHGQTITAGLGYLALGFVVSGSTSLRRWLCAAMAGVAVGLQIMEGFDIGALYSLLIGFFVLFRLPTAENSLARRSVKRILTAGIVAIVAAVIAYHALDTLISTQIKGVAGTQQDIRTKAERWDWATQWSLPKSETFGLFVPGLFGYRMDTPKDMTILANSFQGGNYWGGIGRDPAWDRYFDSGGQGSPPQGFMRFSGGGCYAGVLVGLVAFWATLQAFRKDSVFALVDRKFLWFWIIGLVVSLLLAYGRFAPFYKILYQLPYFSTIRNPAKFLHLFGFSLVIVFAYGIHGLSRRYFETAATPVDGVGARLTKWWPTAAAFERRWVVGWIGAVAVSLLAWLIFYSSHSSLEKYLVTVQFDESMAQVIARFSVGQVGWFILFLILGGGLIVVTLSGAFGGKRALFGSVLLGSVLVADLGRANLPWVVHWNCKQKYETNPVIDFLSVRPYEHRAAILPFRSPPQLSLIEQMYRIEWAQHHFFYTNIQSLDIVQMPRMPQDLQAYETVLQFHGTPETTHLITRRWALTNTRYLLGAAGFLDALNQQIDPNLHRFRIVQRFNIVPKPGISNPSKLEELTAAPADDGSYALFEFTGALPRAKLYSSWQMAIDDPAALNALKTANLNANDLDQLRSIGTNDFLTLQKLASPGFNPEQTALVATPVPAPDVSSISNHNPGTVEFVSYSPKDVKLKANAHAASLLLLNDHYDANWKVWIDGKPTELLRCNFIVRGVQVPAGEHIVEFKFQPPTAPLYVSMSAIGVGILLLGFLAVTRTKDAPDTSPGTPAAKSSRNSKST